MRHTASALETLDCIDDFLGVNWSWQVPCTHSGCPSQVLSRNNPRWGVAKGGLRQHRAVGDCTTDDGICEQMKGVECAATGNC